MFHWKPKLTSPTDILTAVVAFPAAAMNVLPPVLETARIIAASPLSTSSSVDAEVNLHVIEDSETDHKRDWPFDPVH